MQSKQTEQKHPERAGWPLADWCQSVDIARASFYLLSESDKPRLARVGRRIIVCEQPREWLARIAAGEGAKLKRTERAAV